jgi:hypothetical protein
MNTDTFLCKNINTIFDSSNSNKVFNETYRPSDTFYYGSGIVDSRPDTNLSFQSQIPQAPKFPYDLNLLNQASQIPQAPKFPYDLNLLNQASQIPQAPKFPYDLNLLNQASQNFLNQTPTLIPSPSVPQAPKFPYDLNLLNQTIPQAPKFSLPTPKFTTFDPRLPQDTQKNLMEEIRENATKLRKIPTTNLTPIKPKEDPMAQLKEAIRLRYLKLNQNNPKDEENWD